MTLLYLDHAATTPVRPEVLEAMLPYFTGAFGNPSSHHTVGEEAASALADARRRVAAVLGMRAGDVVFTSGGTEANNLAIKGIALAAMQARGARHVVTSPIEHESVLESAAALVRLHGFTETLVPVDGVGRVDPDDLAAALRDDTAVVSIGYANNEVGTVQDAAALAAVCRASGIPFHLDAVQAAGWLPLDAATTGADAVTIAGHKLGAPKGTGVLAVRGRIPLEPLLSGGGQERGRRSGTEDVAGAVALATALELAEAERPESAARVAGIRDAFIARVLGLVPEARLTGDPVHRLPGTASFTFAGTSGEAVLLELERRGIVSSSGSACAAGSDEPSHVLVAMGIAPEVAQTAVRFTLGHDVRAPLDAVADALDSLRAQTLRDWTAILVDDGSTDATGSLFAQAAAADPRFRVVRHPVRRGLGASRNVGVDLVETPFLAFLDADDVMTPTALARLVSLLDETGSDFAAGAYTRLRPDGRGGYAPGEVQPWVVRATSPERRGTTLEDHPDATINVVAWSKVSRTAFWRRTGLRFPEGRLYEDQVVAQQMLTRARRFDVVPDVVVQWRVRADGSSITQGEDRIEVLREALDAMTAGLRVLDDAGHAAAAEARVAQLLRMDVPRLAALAAVHPDDAYRRALGAFVRSLQGRPTRAPLDDDAARAVTAAVLW